jgi:hypothetical protein
MAVQAYSNYLVRGIESSSASTGTRERSGSRWTGIRRLQSPQAEQPGFGAQAGVLDGGAVRDVMVRAFGSWWD